VAFRAISAVCSKYYVIIDITNPFRYHLCIQTETNWINVMANLQIMDSGLQPAEQAGVFSNEQIIEQIGVMADQALFQGKMDILDDAAKLAARVDTRVLSKHQLAIFHYHVSNVWGNSFKLLPDDRKQERIWEQPEIEKQLIHNRLAVSALEASDGASQLPVVCAIYTNLANTLFQIGRFVEALEYWDRALVLMPDFGMAVANKGYALLHYAHLLHDEGHAMIYLLQSREILRQALKLAIDPHVRPFFKDHLKSLNRVLYPYNGKKFLTPARECSENDDGETAFRNWRLQNRLCLNPINDLGSFMEAASDVMMTQPLEKDPAKAAWLQDHFTLLKQEFICARQLYFEAMQSIPDHDAASCGAISPVTENASCDLSVEKLKITFRMAYSLFDKIAFFLKKYFQLPVSQQRVNFRTLWYPEGRKANGLQPKLLQSANWPLRGLFWLSKDLYEHNPDFKEGLEADARQLYALRNHLEHNYLQIQDDAPHAASGKSGFRVTDDASVYVIGRTDFSNRTLRILKMVRAALIYLSLAVHWESSQIP
jgi:tetratricopeptide (TPR) repeat protein